MLRGFSLHGNNPWETSGIERTESSLNSLCTHFSLMSSVIVLLIKRQCVHVALSSWSVLHTCCERCSNDYDCREVCCNALGESHCETALNSPMRTSKSEEQSREERRRRECECEVRVCSSKCVQRGVCVCVVCGGCDRCVSGVRC